MKMLCRCILRASTRTREPSPNNPKLCTYVNKSVKLYIAKFRVLSSPNVVAASGQSEQMYTLKFSKKSPHLESLFFRKFTFRIVNFVGTLPRRYVTDEDERWRVGKLLRFYKIYPRINAIGARVAALDARKRKNSRFSPFFRHHEYTKHNFLAHIHNILATY